MNIETLAVLFGVALAATFFARIVSGWTFAGFLVSFLLGCFGAVGGWYAQQELALPSIYAVPFGNNIAVPVVWPALGALVGALLGGAVRRRAPRARRRLR